MYRLFSNKFFHNKCHTWGQNSAVDIVHSNFITYTFSRAKHIFELEFKGWDSVSIVPPPLSPPPIPPSPSPLLLPPALPLLPPPSLPPPPRLPPWCLPSFVSLSSTWFDPLFHHSLFPEQSLLLIHSMDCFYILHLLVKTKDYKRKQRTLGHLTYHNNTNSRLSKLKICGGSSCWLWQ